MPRTEEASGRGEGIAGSDDRINEERAEILTRADLEPCAGAQVLFALAKFEGSEGGAQRLLIGEDAEVAHDGAVARLRLAPAVALVPAEPDVPGAVADLPEPGAPGPAHPRKHVLPQIGVEVAGVGALVVLAYMGGCIVIRGRVEEVDDEEREGSRPAEVPAVGGDAVLGPGDVSFDPLHISLGSSARGRRRIRNQLVAFLSQARTRTEPSCDQRTGGGVE